MIKVSVLYPNSEGATFDMDYYRQRHIPMVREKFGTTCMGVSFEEGVAGGIPGSPPAYRIMGHLLFDSVESFQATFAPHAQAIMGDIPNFTNVQPVVQISEIRMQT
jgi:uncharacterized protein (TIGR02118 family)